MGLSSVVVFAPQAGRRNIVGCQASSFPMQVHSPALLQVLQCLCLLRTIFTVLASILKTQESGFFGFPRSRLGFQASAWAHCLSRCISWVYAWDGFTCLWTTQLAL